MSDEFAKDILTLSNIVLNENVSDREAAIVSASYIETHIVAIIAAYFPNLTASLKKAFFDETNGMARSYGNKLDMAMALNAITPGTFSDGKIIGRIRNKFAHNLNVDSFEHEKVRDLVDQLQTQRGIKVTHGDGSTADWDEGWNRATRFRHTALGLCSTIMHQHITEYPYSYSTGSSAIGTGARPPLLEKLNRPPPPVK